MHDNTATKKGTHLSYQERCQIAILKQENYSNRAITASLNRAPQTIHNEIKRETVKQKKKQVQNGKEHVYYYTVYDADKAQAAYDNQRLNCGRRPKSADEKMLEDHWSPDVVVGFAKRQELFDPKLIPSTTTLYNWIDSGIMRTKNMDLLEKLSRKPRQKKRSAKENKRILGNSIDERPEEVESRAHFGHWEIDTVIGQKTKGDEVLLTLVERMTRFEVLLKLPGKTSKTVCLAVSQLRERCGDDYTRLFKTVTADNGTEFASLQEALQETVFAYFTHPFASYERGTSEHQHKFIRRFLPKGQKISEICDQQILRIQQWMNRYPRKILNYQSPCDCFLKAFRQEGAAA
nr:IS30 family transposase [Suicoccus acidiformans]